ncbi:MAG: hypothetical protein MUC80_00395 [Candidatus Thermoplasmatota archaeon]|jgi:DNA repair ATPase RecN|nr:hypothetical protein [Candidatus Thermoplasmatota archaeon]
MGMIVINELRVKGTKKDYFVRFRRDLSIIAGEISTGKSSILNLIDYCFGAKESPQYPEISKNGRVALLEIDIKGDIFTIERQLFSTRQEAYIHLCKIEDLNKNHESIEVSSVQKKERESISSFILRKIELWNIPLKEAPTKDSTDVDIMSFRDLLGLCYLKKTRIGENSLLFENNHMKSIKLRQVFDVLFGLYSNKIALLCSEIQNLQEEIQDKNHEIKILMEFAKSEGVPEQDELKKKIEKLDVEINDSEIKLKDINEKITGKSQLAKELREEVLNFEANLQKSRLEKRYYEKTLQRLIPLRGQYSEDISKLHFLTEAKQIVDPLCISICPICFNQIKKDVVNNCCCLCGSKLPESEGVNIDVSKEIRIIERKLRELNSYAEEIEIKLKDNAKQERKILNDLSDASKKLDDTLRRFVSPFLTEREELISIISRNQNEISHVNKYIKVRNDIEKEKEESLKSELKLRELEKTLEEERAKSPDQKEMMNSLSETYLELLEKVKFPKLSNAYIDDRLIPFIRGIKYDKLSSEGAINLASICWIASIYKEAILRNKSHPGFLMLDGLQRGIGLGASKRDMEFRDESIVKGIYDLLKELINLDESQFIVVDNHPPAFMEENIVVYYSGRADQPPYGFIDDEIS